MNERARESPAPPSMVGGASDFGERPRVLVFALKQGGGLLLWPLVRDPAARQWAEVPSMPEAEAELRAAHTQAMRQAPNGAKAREGRGVGLPKLEFGPNCRVRVDVNWSGVQHHLYPATLTPAACATLWKLWVDPLPVAEIPRYLPASVRVPTPDNGEVAGRVLDRGFELENQLEEYLIRNWDRISLSSRLEFMGRQYPTSGGRIDILCKNKDGSGYTVIELKRGQTNYATLGQIQTYMAWVRGSLVKGDQSVWGIIICRVPDSKLMAAVSEARNVDVYSYVRQEQSLVLIPKKN